jgi:hypothetical protein
MDIEYHFYITYIIALRAGFEKDDAYKIAYSSQYTDDNNEPFTIRDDSNAPYKNHISQTMNITQPEERLLRIHPFFHFFPGNTKEIVKAPSRHDGKLHLLNTIPGNSNALKLMRWAFKSNNLYNIGIATHTFADTYAHKNFAGFKDGFNSMKGFLEFLIPNIGHADAKYDPDVPGRVWTDGRLTSAFQEINNNERFLKASEHIYGLFRLKLNPDYPKDKLSKEKTKLRAELESAIGTPEKPNKSKRARRIKYLELIGDDLVSDYKEKAWFKAAVIVKTAGTTVGTGNIEREYWWRENYKERDWFRFQEAVKAHQRKAEKILEPIFSKMEVKELDIW